ncbi:ATP-binding protein [Pedobacter sp. MC2016-05]|uniref:ATP-binding protein n=1 Tax=Pedobacter sp. MC2016-05 TaxID=2994474 RepID=UPI002245AA7A|nr:ATP-binding protein [Pedobacter sp. MC2016-05]MCX2472708.1 ATP-binding protein [Pedobacter sp. MC2016-05]
MENKVSINNNSVEFSGITRDYMEAISELIWNGFDAGATKIDLVFDTNEIDFIPSIEIIDNGSGINLNNLNQTFGAFLDSLKRSTDHRSSYVRGKKGKGRFSFIAFAQTAIWNTTFFDENTQAFTTYDITINASNKDFYADEHQQKGVKNASGTRLKLVNLFGVTAYNFTNDAFINHLKSEFGWFLLLNSKHDFQLCINGERIIYEDLLADHEIFERKIVDASTSRFMFTITFVRWNEKIGDKFYYYFLNSDKKEVFKQLTSFNNNAINFYHSVYIESDYFNLFNFNDTEETGNLFGSNPQSPIFKQLIKALQKIVVNKQKEFVKNNAADELIQKLLLSGSMPKFGSNDNDLNQKELFIELVKAIYCIQPRMFKGLNDAQEKLTLNLIFSQMRDADSLLDLLENVLKPNEEESQQLHRLMYATHLISD